MAKAPQVVGAGATFEAPAPLTPGQQQTAAQLAAAGATKLPSAERPGSDTAGLPADAVSMDLRGTVRVGPYQPADAEYGKRLETRDVAAIDHETADIEAEGQAEAAAAAPKPDPNVKPLYARVGGTAWAAAKDLGGGIVQSPIAVVEGAKEALNNTLDLIDEAGDALDRIVPGTVWVGPDGVEMITQDEASRRKGNNGGFLGRFSLKGKEALTTNTGKFIEKATQFATGFVMGGKVLKGWGAAGKVSGTMKAMAQGAIADFSAFDPHEERLSNMLQDMAPEAAKPIFDYLSADNEDSELVGRTKNAIEGLGLGVVADQVFHGLRALKAARNAKAMARAEAQAGGYQVDPVMAEAAADAEGAQVVAEAEAMLKPGFKRKIDAAAKTAAPVTPAQVLPATGPGAPLANGFFAAAETGDRYRVSSVNSATSVNGAVVIERRIGEGQAAASFYVGADGKLIGHDSINLMDDISSVLWKPESAEARSAAESVLNALGPHKVEAGNPARAALQDALKKLVAGEITPDEARAIADANKVATPVGATIEPNVFDLKFHTFETADDIKAAISTIAERNVDQVDAARGGSQSWATTREAAEGIDWVSSMAARRPGEALNAAHITAYRGALNASAQKLLTLAEEVSVNPSMAAQFAFRRQMATHNAIQMEFMGARAEAGRALNAFKMPVGTPARQLRQIDDLLAENGGAATAQELAKKVLRAARLGDVAMNEIARVGAFAHSRAMVKLLYTNGLLSGLGTPVINVAGNGFALLMNVADRAASPHVARAMGELPHVEAGEGAALLAGYWGALKDAFRMAPNEAVSHMGWQAMKEKGALRSLAPGLDDALPSGLERTGREESGGVSFADQVASKPLSAAAWRVSEDSGLGRTLDFFQMVIETPSNANALMDDFFRVAAARGELQAQAFRQTQQELRAGTLTRDDVRERMAAILASPKPHMLDAAELEMRELTFTRADGGAEKWFSSLREGLDSRGPIPFGTLLMPFVRTPANIMSMAMRHAPLAPWMARYTKDIAAGGARAELARSKWAVGTAAYALFIDMAMNGQITGGGPGNKGQRDAMSREDANGGVSWQPYSVRVGDRWINYERADPLGTAMSLAADYSEILANDDWDSGSIQTPGEVGAHIVGAFGHAFFDKTMLRSVFDTMGAVTSGNVAEAEKMLKDRATGMIPFSSALRMVRRGDDEYMRETSGVLDGLRNMTPGLSTTLPPQRDLWGRERTYQSGLGMVYDAISPVKTKAAGGSAIDIEILDLGVSVVMPTKSMQIDGERVSLRNRLDIYSTFVAAAGQPAYDHLEAVVTGNHADSDFYFGLTDGPSGGKAEYIKDVIEDYRKLAREQVMEIYGDELQTMAEQARRAREQARD